MIEINSFSVSKMNNAEVCALFINLQKLLTDADRPNLGVENDIYLLFTNKLNLLVDQVYASTTSVNTAAMKAADTKRTTIYRRLRTKLSAAEYVEQGSSLAAVAEKVRAHFLSKYLSKVSTMAIQEKTAVISGFVMDLNSKLDEDEQELLGIAGDVTRLEQANNAFIAAYQARTTERAEQELQVTNNLRKELSELFSDICVVLLFYANSKLEANATKAAACQNFIKLVNVILSEAKARYLARLSRADNASGSQGNGGETPAADDAGNQNPADGAGNEVNGGSETPESNGGSDDNPAGGSENPSTENPGDSNPNGGYYHDGVTEF